MATVVTAVFAAGGLTMALARWRIARSAFFATVLQASASSPAPKGGACLSRTIATLPERIDGLPGGQRDAVRSIFDVSARRSDMVIPDSFAPKMARWTRSDGQSDEDALRSAAAQRAIVITDLVEARTAHYNPLRAHKPIAFTKPSAGSAYSEISATEGAGSCDFCAPETMTSSEPWGRLHGAHSLTAANAFRADGAHGMLVFRRHDPLGVTLDELRDGLDVVTRWYERTREHIESGGERPARAQQPGPAEWHPVLWWNAMGKSSASQIHPHMQMYLSPSAPGRARLLRTARAQYAAARGAPRADRYYTDLVAAHSALGLATRVGAASVLASLTPRAPAGELLVVGDAGAPLSALAPALHAALRALIDGRHCRSFSMAFTLPPMRGGSAALRGTAEEGASERVVAAILDRGDIESRTADVGGVDLVHGATIVNVDPYAIMEALDPARRSAAASSSSGGTAGSPAAARVRGKTSDSELSESSAAPEGPC